MPVSVRPALRRLARRLAAGLFLDVWPAWAVASLLLAGLVALVCRLFLPGAASSLHWLWLTPVLMAIPAIVICFRRSYRSDDVVAVADWLNGGQGMLLTLLETNDLAWAESPLAEYASTFSLPRLRPWRKLAALPPAVAFLAIALWLPQRVPPGTDSVLADDIAVVRPELDVERDARATQIGRRRDGNVDAEGSRSVTRIARKHVTTSSAQSGPRPARISSQEVQHVSKLGNRLQAPEAARHHQFRNTRSQDSSPVDPANESLSDRTAYRSWRESACEHAVGRGRAFGVSFRVESDVIAVTARNVRRAGRSRASASKAPPEDSRCVRRRAPGILRRQHER